MTGIQHSIRCKFFCNKGLKDKGLKSVSKCFKFSQTVSIAALTSYLLTKTLMFDWWKPDLMIACSSGESRHPELLIPNFFNLR